jgi:c-di-GMP-binding flagellar brake protein YcgR
VSQGELITDNAFIYVVLKRFLQNRSLLVASVPGTPGQYNTTILSISDARDWLELDELNLKRGHDAVLKEKVIHLTGTQQGVRVEMKVKVLQVDSSESISRYQVEFPREILYHQKRQSYRVNVGADIAFPIRITKNKKVYRGNIADISETGMGITVPSRVPANRGEDLEDCLLHLPNDEKIFCKLRICHIEYDDKHNLTQIGSKVIEMDLPAKRAYQRAIQYVQREMIRRQARVN